MTEEEYDYLNPKDGYRGLLYWALAAWVFFYWIGLCIVWFT